MNKTLQAALNFHDAGICVIPAKTDGSKAPFANWKQYQNERPSREQVIEWFKDGHEGIGIVTGAISGNLEMLELEGRAVKDGLLKEAMDMAIASNLGDIWNLVTSGYTELTPSGGLHFLYQIVDEPVPGNYKLARRPGDADSVEVLVETRGEGGFVVTAPSSGATHPSGKAWEMVAGSPATIAAITFEQRNALHDIFAAQDKMPAKEEFKVLINKDAQGDRPGDEFNSQATWKEILEPKGWKKVYTKNGETYWRRPGKSIGISASTGKNESDNLYVFSTSTKFEANKPYSKFAALTLLEFDGNFSEASRYLRSKGYGKPNDSFPSLDNVIQLPPRESEDSIEPASYENSTWKSLDLQPFLDGTFQPPKTEIFKRNDGESLFYPGKVHSIYGESESGKSWIAQMAVAEQLKQNQRVIYIDFESDALDIVNRLKTLKVSQAEILQYFSYIRPDTSYNPSDPNWQKILEPGTSLVIIDGVTEALNLWGKETKDNDGITQWMRIFPRVIASRSGACVVTIDHVTKDKETRGRFAIGGQAKLATIDGAAYLVEPLEALAPGRIGTLTVRVTKDRPGFVRRIAGLYRKSDRTQEVAVITIDSTREQMELVIAPPMLEDQVKAQKLEKLDSDIVNWINSHPGSAKSKAVRGIEGWDDKTLLARIDSLIEDGVLENQGNARNFILYVTQDGMARFNLVGAVVLPIQGSGA